MSVGSGIAGLTLEPGGHVCRVFRTVEERDGIMASFFRAGLLAGERSVVVVDAADAGAVLSRVGSPSEITHCLYDLNRFGAGVLIDAIRTHPKVIVGAQVIQNPYYRSPEQFVAAHPGPVRSADPTPAQDEMAEAGVGSSARSGPGRAGRPDPTAPG
jgi:hypothetical protein